MNLPVFHKWIAKSISQNTFGYGHHSLIVRGNGLFLVHVIFELYTLFSSVNISPSLSYAPFLQILFRVLMSSIFLPHPLVLVSCKHFSVPSMGFPTGTAQHQDLYYHSLFSFSFLLTGFLCLSVKFSPPSLSQFYNAVRWFFSTTRLILSC